MSRRAVVVGAAPMAMAALGATTAIGWQLSRPPEPRATAQQQALAASTPAEATAVPGERRVIATPEAVATPVRRLTDLPDGMALIASPRLPVAAVGSNAVGRLLNGEIADWRALGAPSRLPVRVLALEGERTGVSSNESFENFGALAAAMAVDPGSVAVVPGELVDFRVQTLVVGGADPLLEPAGGQQVVRVGVVGDIVPGRNVHLHMARYGDFTRPFQRVAPLLRSFDVMIANLEGNISDTLPQPADPHSFSFVSNSAMLEGFALAGIDAVTLANNHSVWNDEGWGVQGLLDTLTALEANGVSYFGAGRDLSAARAPWVTEVNGTRLAFLGIDGVTANYEIEPGVENGVVDFDAGAGADWPGTNPYLAAQVTADIAAAREVADIVIPYFHFGAEYVAVPPSWSVAAARAAIDAGAAMVLTNHPHVIQGMETYGGKPIVYSPGNFIFDQMFSVEVRSGYVLEIVFRGTTIAGLRFYGIEIEEFHQPRLMTAGERSALLNRFWAATDRRKARDGTAS